MIAQVTPNQFPQRIFPNLSCSHNGHDPFLSKGSLQPGQLFATSSSFSRALRSATLSSTHSSSHVAQDRSGRLYSYALVLHSCLLRRHRNSVSPATTIQQAAEEVGAALDFGWRSGSPLR